MQFDWWLHRWQLLAVALLAIVGLVLAAVAVAGRVPLARSLAVETVEPSPTQPVDPAPSPSPTADPSPSPDPTSPVPNPVPAQPSPTPSPEPAPKPATPSEVRAVWVHLFDDTLKTRSGIRSLVDDVAAANANLLIVEVVRRHDAYYDSDVLPRTNDPKLEPGLDVLDHVLELAHAKGIAVQAWVPIAPTYHHAYDDIPAPDNWVWTEHGPSAPVSERWVTRTRDGTWSEYLDPSLPEVVDHVAAIFAELAAYPVDGVHLDYARYAGAEYGYHPRVLDRFRVETGRSGTPSPTDREWSNWRRAQVTKLVAEVRSAVRAVDKSVPVTGAVIAQGEGPSALGGFRNTRGYAEFFQDWASWTEDGLLDMAVPMIYFDEDSHGTWFDDWVDWSAGLAQRSESLVVGGQGSWLNAVDHSVIQLRHGHRVLDGVSVYSYQQNAASEPYDQLLRRLSRGLWEGPARVPARFRPHAP